MSLTACELPRPVDLRARTGRPHRLLADEAHHVLPAGRDPGVTALPPTPPATVFVAVGVGVRAKAAFALRARNELLRPKRALAKSALWRPRFVTLAFN